MGFEKTLNMQTRMVLRKWLFVFICALLSLLAVALFTQQIRALPKENRRILLFQFTENEVFTKIELRESPSKQLELLGTFTPTRAHFHLYSKDLPKNGLNGLGRPTLLEVISLDGIKLAGPLMAYQPTNDLYIKTLELSFSTYPEGSVMLGIPLELASNANSSSMELSVTYMACSERTCLPPVIDKHFIVQMPKEIFERH